MFNGNRKFAGMENEKKRIVVSGASKGIGKAVALKFAEAGFSVAIYARNEEALRETKAELLKAGAPDVMAKVVDASVPGEALRFGEDVLAKWRGIQVLVNNVGIFTPDNILNSPLSALQKMMQVNLYSAYELTGILQAAMPADGKSYIFNICSTASLQAYPAGNLYAITKHALLGFSRGLREELKGQIRVSAILPGAVYTDSWKGTDLPQNRFMATEDIAAMIWQAWQTSPRTVVDELILRPMQGDI